MYAAAACASNILPMPSGLAASTLSNRASGRIQPAATTASWNSTPRRLLPTVGFAIRSRTRSAAACTMKLREPSCATAAAVSRNVARSRPPDASESASTTTNSAPESAMWRVLLRPPYTSRASAPAPESAAGPAAPAASAAGAPHATAAHADLCAGHAARWHLGPQYHSTRHRVQRCVADAPHTALPRGIATRTRSVHMRHWSTFRARVRSHVPVSPARLGARARACRRQWRRPHSRHGVQHLVRRPHSGGLSSRRGLCPGGRGSSLFCEQRGDAGTTSGAAASPPRT
jgi:hypothetical protein